MAVLITLIQDALYSNKPEGSELYFMLQALKIRLLIYSHLLQVGSTVIKCDLDGFS